MQYSLFTADVQNWMPQPATAVQKQFWDLVEVGPIEDCWKWKRVPNDTCYGQWKGRGAHIWAWSFAHPDQKIVKGQVIMHICSNPNCCNPNHLRLGSQKENMMDCAYRRRTGGFGGHYMKRVIAEVTDEFFWELKQKTVQTQLKQKTIVILSIHKTMQMEVPLVDLIDPEEYARVISLGLIEV